MANFGKEQGKHIADAKFKLKSAKTKVETEKKSLKGKQAALTEAKAQQEAAQTERKAINEQLQAAEKSVQGNYWQQTSFQAAEATWYCRQHYS